MLLRPTKILVLQFRRSFEEKEIPGKYLEEKE